MIEHLAFLAVLSLLSAAVVRWASSEVQSAGELSSLPIVAVGLCAVVWLYAVVGAALSATWKLPVPSVVALVAGTLVAANGLVLASVALVVLRLGDREPGALAVDGIYGRIRHPQALGAVLLLAGVAIAGRSLLGLAMSALFAIAAWRFVRIEESVLGRRHGAAFDSYRAATPAVATWRREARAGRSIRLRLRSRENSVDS